MYATLLAIHSLLRWLVLVALVVRFARGLQGSVTGTAWGRVDRILSGSTLGLTHLQVVLGILLYGMSPLVAAALADMGAAMKDPTLRFWAVEHITTMILAAIAVQVGFSVAKRASTDSGRHRITTAGFGIGLLLVLAGIPWGLRGGL